MQIDMIHRKNGFAVASDGKAIPVVKWIGDDGDDCDEPEAICAVCGPDADGKWWSIDLREFSPVATN